MLKIAFNSYKGGACRTTTCYNVLPYLARRLNATKDEPILVFDVDLDSMGLTTLLKFLPKGYSARNLFVNDKDGINSRLESLGLNSVQESRYFFDIFAPVGRDLGLEDNEAVLFCGADATQGNITDSEYNAYKKNPPLYQLLTRMEYMDPQPKAIVFDCAAGVQQSTLAVLACINRSVMCMRPTDQFRYGTAMYLKKHIKVKFGEFFINEPRKVILVPTSVSSINISEDEPNATNARQTFAEMRKDAKRNIVEDVVKPVTMDLKQSGSKYELNCELLEAADWGLPEIERFKWRESQLLYNCEELTKQEAKLKERYAFLAELICKEDVKK